jgi:hypothetical protein
VEPIFNSFLIFVGPYWWCSINQWLPRASNYVWSAANSILVYSYVHSYPAICQRLMKCHLLSFVQSFLGVKSYQLPIAMRHCMTSQLPNQPNQILPYVTVWLVLTSQSSHVLPRVIYVSLLAATCQSIAYAVPFIYFHTALYGTHIRLFSPQMEPHLLMWHQSSSATCHTWTNRNLLRCSLWSTLTLTHPYLIPPICTRACSCTQEVLWTNQKILLPGIFFPILF